MHEYTMDEIREDPFFVDPDWTPIKGKKRTQDKKFVACACSSCAGCAREIMEQPGKFFCTVLLEEKENSICGDCLNDKCSERG